MDARASSFRTRQIGGVSHFGAGARIRSRVTLCPSTQLETLFHEFGHVAHSLLGRTDYQHMSGTRTSQDIVEVRSQLPFIDACRNT